MKRWMLVLLGQFLFSVQGVSLSIVENDFNNKDWGPMSHGSYWTMRDSGGVGNSSAARLEYSVAGTAGKALGLNVKSFKSNEFWIEMDVRMENNPSGGCKFLKFFGSVSTHSMNNMTLGIDNYGNVQREVAYYKDTICTARFNGTNGGTCRPTHVKTGSSIDMRDGKWGHYKAWVKRATPGTVNGEVMIWWNGVLKAHIKDMDSNPKSLSPFFERIELGGYTHSTFDGKTWYLWIDNLYIGTTEKGGSGSGNGNPVPMSPPTNFKVIK